MPPPADLEVLEFERETFKHPGARIGAIRERFGLTETRYSQRLNRILDDPAAVAYDPVHVNRLLRLREARRTNRRTA
jgi:hypothetical protein